MGYEHVLVLFVGVPVPNRRAHQHDISIEISLSEISITFSMFSLKGISSGGSEIDDKIFCRWIGEILLFFQLDMFVAPTFQSYTSIMHKICVPCMFYCRFGVIFFKCFCF